MKKTATPVNAAKHEGLLLVLALTMLLTAPWNQVIAQTTDSAAIAPIGSAAGTEVVPAEPPSIQDRLLKVCENHGYGEACAKALLGMAWKESQFVATAVGDHGLAHGWFQIHYKLHKITRACTEDLECSANWTIKYMESNGYPKYPKYAVQCHNGCNIANGYAASALRHGERLWNHEDKQIALAK